jgi:hypothetical protein
VLLRSCNAVTEHFEVQDLWRCESSRISEDGLGSVGVGIEIEFPLGGGGGMRELNLGWRLSRRAQLSSIEGVCRINRECGM